MSNDTLSFIYGTKSQIDEHENDISPGTVYFIKNEDTQRGEIYFDTPDEDSKRFSIIGGGIYVAEDSDDEDYFPEGYTIKVDPNGLVTSDTFFDMKNKIDVLMNSWGKYNVQVVKELPSDFNTNIAKKTFTFVVPDLEG